MTGRIAKVLLVLSLAAFALIVTYDNLVDYGSNFAFVRHVLSMDSTFAGNALVGRAIAHPLAWHIAYAAIIATEGTTGLLLLMGAWSMWCARRRDAAGFRMAKRWAIAGCTVAFLLWFVGFMVVGGEWFAMWQSKEWNGQEGAFRFYMAVLGVLIFVSQPDEGGAGDSMR